MGEAKKEWPKLPPGRKWTGQLDEEVQALRRFAVDTERRFSHWQEEDVAVHRYLEAWLHKAEGQIARLRESTAHNFNYFADKGLDTLTLLASLCDQKNDLLKRVMQLEKWADNMDAARDKMNDRGDALRQRVEILEGRVRDFFLMLSNSSALDNPSPAMKFKRGVPGKPKAAPKRRK